MDAKAIEELRMAFGDPLEPESWHDGKVLRLIEEREELLREAKRAQSVGEIKFRTCHLAADVADGLAAAIAKAEAP